MNRYVAEGLANDARVGKRVVFLGRNGVELREAFQEVCEIAFDALRISSTAGARKVEYGNGGSVVFLNAGSVDQFRGRLAEVVFLDLQPTIDQDFSPLLTLIAPMLASTGGELLRA